MILKRSTYHFMLLLLGLCMLIEYHCEAAWLPPVELGFGSERGFGELKLASDANGHAIALISTDDRVTAYYFIDGLWEPTVLDELNPSSVNDIAIAMEPSGTGLAIWSFNGDPGNSAYFDGTSWSIPLPAPDIPVDALVSVAMKGPGEGVAVWIDQAGGGTIETSFFSNGAWSLPVIIGASDSNVIQVAYSPEGTAVAGWTNGGLATVRTFTKLAQGPIVILDITDPGNSFRSVGVDAAGNALALWESSTGDVLSRFFDGSTWLPEQTVATGPGNINSSLSMSSAGTAVAIWVNSSANGFSNSFNGTTWGNPIPFTSDTLFETAPSISVNSSGLAQVIFANIAIEIKSARLPLGGVWGNEEVLQSSPPQPGFENLSSSLSDNGMGFATWLSRTSTTEGKFPFADATVQPTPPIDPEGRVCKLRFAFGSDKINIITWDPSTDLTVVAYNVRRNGVLIATIPASGPFTFAERHSCSCRTVDVYTVSAVNGIGIESESVLVIFD